MKKQEGNHMLEKEKIETLESQFQRILTLPVTRSTFRELQNALYVALNQDDEKTNTFTDDLLTNRPSNFPEMLDFVKHYAIPFRVAKQVQDSGEVLSMLTTDVGIQGGNLIFSVRMRRIDGGEFNFLTDVGGFLQVAEHILSRIESVGGNSTNRAVVGTLKKRFEAMGTTIDRLANF